ncbi:MAG: flagellar export chaperone FliS [Desulfovibrionaceae bacterium]|nr:flagellar export chaperone FliS [Desulfovibrionaceae bacterium]
MQKVTHAYLQTNLSTDSPGRTILALYDGAITFLSQAKERVMAKDYANKGILISKTMAILNELSSSLNREKGGALAENLCNLYFWCNTQLAVANMRMQISLIDDVLKVLSGLRDAFAKIQNTPEAQAAARQISDQQAVSASSTQIRAVDLPLMMQGAASGGMNARGRNLYGKMAAQQ